MSPNPLRPCPPWTFVVLCAALAVAALVGLAQPARAQQQELTLLVADPLDDNGKPAPFPADWLRMFDYIERESGLRFRLARYPWKRALVMVENGDGLIFGISRNAEREKTLHFSQTVFRNFVWLATREDAQFEFNGIEDLKGRKIGVVAGVVYSDAFERERGKLFTVETDPISYKSRFSKLLRHRADALLLNSAREDAKLFEGRIEEIVAKLGLEGTSDSLKIAVLPKPLEVDEVHFAIRADQDPAILKKIDAAIAKGKKAGAFERDAIRADQRSAILKKIDATIAKEKKAGAFEKK